MKRRRHKLEVSTFPFLAVLLCAMGSLIFVLLVMDRKASMAARFKAQKAVQAQAEEVTQRNAKILAENARRQKEAKEAWEDARRLLRARLETQKQQLDAQTRAVQEKKTEASSRAEEELAQLVMMRRALETEKARLLGEQQALVQARDQVGALEGAHQAEKRSALSEMSAELVRLEQTMKELLAARQRDAHTYSVIPYKGKNGESKRPIYIECARDRVVLHPEKVALNPDFDTAAVRAEVQKRITRQRAQWAALKVNTDDPPYLMLLVRPDGVVTYYHLQGALRGMEVQYGYELIDVDWVLDFPAEEQAPEQPWMVSTPGENNSDGSPSPRTVAGNAPRKVGVPRAGNAVPGSPQPGEVGWNGNPGTGTPGGWGGAPGSGFPGVGPPGNGIPGMVGGAPGLRGTGNSPSGGAPGSGFPGVGPPGNGVPGMVGGAPGLRGTDNSPSGGTPGMAIATQGVSGTGNFPSGAGTPGMVGGAPGLGGTGNSPSGGTQGMPGGAGNPPPGSGWVGRGNGSPGNGNYPPGPGPAAQGDWVGGPRGSGQGNGPGDGRFGTGVGPGNGGRQPGGPGTPGQGLAGNGTGGQGWSTGNQQPGQPGQSGRAGQQGDWTPAYGARGGNSSGNPNVDGSLSGQFSGQPRPGAPGQPAQAGLPVMTGPSAGVNGPGTQVAASGGNWGNAMVGSPGSNPGANAGGQPMGYQGGNPGAGPGDQQVGDPGANAGGQPMGYQGGNPGANAGAPGGSGSPAGQGPMEGDGPSGGTPPSGMPAGAPSQPSGPSDPSGGSRGEARGWGSPGALPSPGGSEGGPGGSAEASAPAGKPMRPFGPPVVLPVATNTRPRRSPAPLRAAQISGDRDWVIFVECQANGVVLYPSRQLILVSGITPDPNTNQLLGMLQLMIARRQAQVRPGELPYRPQVRFLVRPEFERTFHKVYPTLDNLGAPVFRQTLIPEDDVLRIVAEG
jgi:hypothetical protein